MQSKYPHLTPERAAAVELISYIIGHRIAWQVMGDRALAIERGRVAMPIVRELAAQLDHAGFTFEVVKDDRPQDTAGMFIWLDRRMPTPPGNPVPDPEPRPSCCAYEDCDQDPMVMLGLDGPLMCEHHAAVSLLAGMSPEDARAAVNEARGHTWVAPAAAPSAEQVPQ